MDLKLVIQLLEELERKLPSNLHPDLRAMGESSIRRWLVAQIASLLDVFVDVHVPYAVDEYERLWSYNPETGQFWVGGLWGDLRLADHLTFRPRDPKKPLLHE